MNHLLKIAYKHLWATLLILMFALNVIIPPPAIAAELSADWLKQTPVEINVSLSNTDNELKFEPNQLDFQVGNRYKLRLTNPSQLKHYFTAKDFADAVWTQKVEAGKVEIKGNIRELELKPSAVAEWVFIPLKPGKYGLKCPIAGHTEAGMIGTITIN